ncbi:MAG: Gfo/Idh/MocA family oxidoreductase [Planctomycetes bacterium]|nr:Gfo/Idh/MocA family oxidoreductase [Planctomycetota bacterium]
MNVSRREVLFGAALAPFARVLGGNDDLRIGVVGLRSRGWDHVTGFAALPGVRVVALCDVDRAVLGQRVEEFQKKYGATPRTCADVRELCDMPDVDAISIATPNHWHALMAIWAMQAGKHVYVEKPVSHSIREGRAIVDWQRRTGLVVQAGTQCRSSTGLQDAIAFLRAGGLGRITVARGLCYKPRPSIGRVDGDQPIPDGVDYELWCGPAAKAPLRRKSLHYDWHWVWSTGNGDLGNQGIHQMDICRWALGEASLPPATRAWGGRVGYVDDGETPNTMVVVHEYATAPLVFEVRGLPRATGAKEMDRFLGASVGCVIHGEGGWMSIPSYSEAKAFDRDGKLISEWQGGGDHYANFVDAVRHKDPGRLTAPIVEGHVSSALCHLGNVSLRLGAPADPAAIAETVAGDVAASEAHARMREHLRVNAVDLAATPLALGRRLRIEPSSEAFLGEDADAAEALARGSHRAPFTMQGRG